MAPEYASALADMAAELGTLVWSCFGLSMVVGYCVARWLATPR